MWKIFGGKLSLKIFPVFCVEILGITAFSVVEKKYLLFQGLFEFSP